MSRKRRQGGRQGVEATARARTKPSRGPPFQAVLAATSFAGLAAEPESWADSVMVASAVVADDRCFNIDAGSWMFPAWRADVTSLICLPIDRRPFTFVNFVKEGKDVLAVWGRQGRGRSAGLDDGGRGGAPFPSFAKWPRVSLVERGARAAAGGSRHCIFAGPWALDSAVTETLAHSRRAAIPPLSCPRSSAPQPSSFPSTPPLNAASNTKKRHSHATPSALLAKDPASNLGHSCCWQDREARADERDACEACLCDSPPSPTVVDDIPELLAVRPPLLSARSPPTSNGPQGPRACDCDSLRQSARLSTSRPPAH